MVTINLKKYYPDQYNEDTYVEVSDEVADFMEEERRSAENSRRRVYRYHAQYSLDADDGIEEESLLRAFKEAEAHEELRLKLEMSMQSLTAVQYRRVKMRFEYGMKFSEIAKAEGVNINAIEDSIKRALGKITKYFC